MHNLSGAAVTFSEVTVALGGVSILQDVSANVPAGSCTAIVGPNGAGKTTLLLTLLGEVPYTGTITLQTPGSAEKPRIGYVPQKLNFDAGLPLTVLEFMALGEQRRPLWLGVSRRVRERALELLGAVRAQELLKRRLGALSGGELQRVLLALALQQRPQLLILDEPAAGVDVRGGQLFCELLDGLRRQYGFTQLMVSHDLSTVTHHAGHVICLNHRVAAEGAPQAVLTPQNLSAVFGLHMGMLRAEALPGGSATVAAGICQGACCACAHTQPTLAHTPTPALGADGGTSGGASGGKGCGDGCGCAKEGGDA